MIEVDPEDKWLLQDYKWYIKNNGYVATGIKIDGLWRTMYLHHCLMGVPIWEGDEIDHINRNKEDNRRSNLRYVTHKQNTLNRSGELEETELEYLATLMPRLDIRL